MDRSCTGHGSGQEDHEEDHLKHPETMRIDEVPRVWVGSGHVLMISAPGQEESAKILVTPCRAFS